VAVSLLSANDQRNIVLYFAAEWSSPCQTMDAIVGTVIAEGYPLMRVDGDGERGDLVRRFAVASVPCFVQIVDGHVATRHTGITTRERLIELCGMSGRRPMTPAEHRRMAEVMGAVSPKGPDRYGWRASEPVQRALDPEGIQSTSAASVQADGGHFAERLNQFSVDLFKQISQRHPRENVVCSPVSVHILLALLAEGAGGQTRAELLQALRWSESAGSPLVTYRKVLQMWNDPGKERPFELSVAARLWCQSGLAVDGKFESRAGELADIEFIDFFMPTARERINEWVADKTGEKISDLIPQGFLDPQRTNMVGTSAVYFNGKWAAAFDRVSLQDFSVSPGKVVQVPMMYRTHSFRVNDARSLAAYPER
jgi:hypothetical protein